MEFSPYVGVTGFKSRNEIDTLIANLPAPLFELSGRQLMVGVLMSSKTLKGHPNNWPGSYPPAKDVAGIFPDSPYLTNIIHYNTEHPHLLEEDLKELMNVGGENCHGVQLNIPWPEMNALFSLKGTHPNARVILQIGQEALKIVHWNTDRLVEKLRTYIDQEVITDVLYDTSGGKGRNQENAEEVSGILQPIMSAFFNQVGIGYAGGLSHMNLGPVGHLNRMIPFLSIDAQGALRDPQEDPRNNHLNLYWACSYVIRAMCLLTNKR